VDERTGTHYDEASSYPDQVAVWATVVKVFLSHSSKDKPFVNDLRSALELRGCAGWLDARELRGGEILSDELKQAIEAADAFALFVSPASLQSEWVGAELKHALKVQRQRKKAGTEFPVIPLCLDDTKLGVLRQFFKDEPLHISVSSEPGGVEAAIPVIEAALGVKLPTYELPAAASPARPQEELVLELTDPDFFEEEGKRRPRAQARLVYQPAAPGKRAVQSSRFVFTAPLGPIELEDIRWYLEEYAVWPGGYVDRKARDIEGRLNLWGQQLFDAAVPGSSAGQVMGAWTAIDSQAARRFSVQVDKELPDGTDEDRVAVATEAATGLLGLPWELLRDGDAFLFQGRKPVRVRRRLPNTRTLDEPRSPRQCRTAGACDGKPGRAGPTAAARSADVSRAGRRVAARGRSEGAVPHRPL